MTIRQLFNKTSETLLSVSDESVTETRLILAHILKIPPSELINHYDHYLTSNQKLATSNLITRRLTGKPLQYILKEAWFYNYPFYVDDRVLIPRPETEFIVTKALEWIKVNYLNPGTPPNPLFREEGASFSLQERVRVRSPLVIVDIGTGCGNIAITLTLELNKLLHNHKPISSALEKRARNPMRSRYQAGEFLRQSPPAGGSPTRNDITFYATDISSDALAVAKLNARNLLTANSHQLSANLHFLPGSLLEPLSQSASIILTNLPYIPTDRIPHLQTEVKNHEPHLALDGGEDGLQLYRQLFQQLKTKWRSPGLFLAEIDYTHRHIAADIFKQYLPQSQVSIIIDPMHKQPFLIATI